MKRCLLLVNGNKDDPLFIRELKSLAGRKKFKLTVGYDHKKIKDSINFVFSINYRKIIPAEYLNRAQNGVFVFHGSDLPKGRGWAPIYHSIASGDKKYVLTMLKINEKVDGGEIIAKAYFKKRAGENADSLRTVDRLMTFEIINEVIGDLLLFNLSGQKQEGEGSYCRQRTPSDSEVRAEDSIKKVHYHCLAVTNEHPAFYYYKNKKYIINIRPELLDELNEKDIKIVSFYKVIKA